MKCKHITYFYINNTTFTYRPSFYNKITVVLFFLAPITPLKMYGEQGILISKSLILFNVNWTEKDQSGYSGHQYGYSYVSTLYYSNNYNKKKFMNLN